MNEVAQRPTFEIREIPAAELARHAGCLAEIWRGALDGVVVRGLFPAEQMRAVEERLARRDPPFFVFPAAEPRFLRDKHLYGMTLVVSDRRRDEYFDVAESFRRDCRTLFLEGADFEGLMREIFVALSGGWPAELPCDPRGRAYTPATIRILPEGSQIELHCDNNLAQHPSYDHLRSLAGIDDQLSYFVTLSAPDSGGELILYGRQWQGEEGAHEYGQSDDLVEDRPALAVHLDPGDLVLFAGGRIYHRVSPVRGPRPRRTIGGFLASSLQDQRIYFWS
jgi:hypothetical protein